MKTTATKENIDRLNQAATKINELERTEWAKCDAFICDEDGDTSGNPYDGRPLWLAVDIQTYHTHSGSDERQRDNDVDRLSVKVESTGVILHDNGSGDGIDGRIKCFIAEPKESPVKYYIHNFDGNLIGPDDGVIDYTAPELRHLAFEFDSEKEAKEAHERLLAWPHGGVTNDNELNEEATA